MKLLKYIIFLPFALISCGDNIREEVIERYDNGEKKLLVIYKGEGSKEKIIERITYNINGDTVFWEKPLEDFYFQKVREEVTEKFKDGKKKIVLKFIGEFENEKLIERIKYNQKGDTLSIEKPLESFIMIREYYSNGKIQKEENFKGGEKNGKWRWYYENGQIKKEGNLKDGKEDGKWFTYHKNGQIMIEGNYKNGKFYGKWIRYYENGQIKKEGNYKDDNIDGKWIRYYENGQIIEVVNFKDGELIETTKY